MQACRATREYTIEPVPRILIVEPGLGLADQLDDVLRRYGFETEVVNTGAAALQHPGAFDLVLLDLSLPDADGLDVCGRLARRGALVVISAEADDAERVTALELGADDAMTKPLELRELVARCRAVLRRTQRLRRGRVVRIGELDIDVERHEARLGSRPLELTTKELGLLVALARRVGTLVRRDELAREVWEAGVMSVNRTLDAHMSSLRRKLGDTPHQPRYIQTVHGLGFRLKPGSWPTAGDRPAGPHDG